MYSHFLRLSSIVEFNKLENKVAPQSMACSNKISKNLRNKQNIFKLLLGAYSLFKGSGSLTKKATIPKCDKSS